MSIFLSIGTWLDDCKTGEGSVTFSSAETFEGNWKDNLLHGDGTFYFADGFTYHGTWCMNEKEGVGEFAIPAELIEAKCLFVKNQRVGKWLIYREGKITYDEAEVKMMERLEMVNTFCRAASELQ